ncbi:MAG: hypothetical protein IPM06_17695 [Rhizobiales bacterium]|nr:hypothetical protein [Hyphomicrobiales bacterium]
MNLATIATEINAASSELKTLLREIDSPERMIARVQVLYDVAVARGWLDVEFHLSHALAELQAQNEREGEQS